MKVYLDIYITAAGQEKVAKGESLSYWDFDSKFTALEGVESWKSSPTPTAQLVASKISCSIPSQESCAVKALAALEAERARIQLEAANSLRELQERASKLQALAYTPSATSGA
jgi:hypothetical protein